MEVRHTRPKRLTRAETKARTRARLLDAAAQAFARKGFTGASVGEIAEGAGFSIGALYSNFANKEEVFIELLSSRSSDRLAEAATIVSDQDSSVDESRSALTRFMIAVADDGDLAPLQAEFWLYAIRRPEFQSHLAAQFRGNRDALATMLADRAQDRGTADGVPFADLATVVLALFQGFVQFRRTDPELVPESLYDNAVHWLFTGINNALGEKA
jgi:AcrR family transcriptional regulator